MTDMGETFSGLEGAARKIQDDIGVLIRSDLVTDIMDLQAITTGGVDPMMADSVVILGQLSAAYTGLLLLLPSGMMAAETIEQHARHWRG